MAQQQLAHEAAANDDVETLALVAKSYDMCLLVTFTKENVLHTAAINGKCRAVAFLLQTTQAAKLSCQRNYRGRCALYLAVKKGHLPVVQQLVQNHPDLSLWRDDKRNENPLELAIRTGFVDAVVIMAQRTPKITYDCPNPIHKAVESGCLKILECLVPICPKSLFIARDDDRIFNFGEVYVFMTPFQRAIQAEQLDMVKLMLHVCPQVIDVYARGLYDVPPFFTSAQCKSPDIFHYLLDSYPRVVYQCDNQGRNVLAYIANPDLAAKVVEKNPALLTQVDAKNRLAAYNALLRNDVPMLHFFLQHVPNLLQHQNITGSTLLQDVQITQWDSTTDYIDCINAILMLQPDIQDRDFNKNNALHIAVQNCSPNLIASVFASRRASLHETNKKDKTPMDVAIKRQDQTSMRLFLPYLTLERVSDSNLPLDLQTQARELCNEPIRVVLPPDLVDIVQNYIGGLFTPTDTDVKKKKKRTRE